MTDKGTLYLSPEERRRAQAEMNRHKSNMIATIGRKIKAAFRNDHEEKHLANMDRWQHMQKHCPWKYAETCLPVRCRCEPHNCAFWHWKKEAE